MFFACEKIMHFNTFFSSHLPYFPYLNHLPLLSFISVKLSTRLTIPALLALALGLSIGGLFLWQIHQSVNTIESSFGTSGTSLLKKLLPGDSKNYPTSAMQSQALIELRQGEIFELKGEWKQAQEKYKRSVESGGGAPALKKLAAIQLQRREYDDASKTIDALKDENPESEDVMLLEGILALRRGNPSEATAVFNTNPESPQGLYGLALVSIVNGDHEKAKTLLAKAAQAGEPAIRTAANVVIQSYNEFALFPDGQQTHLSTLLARSLAQVNECEMALLLVNPVVLTQPSYRDAWIVKGFCEFTTERTRDALASLEQAYALDPEKPEIQYFLARTYAALGDPQNAVTFLQYAVVNGFSPERDARELLADYAQELGNIELALEQYRIIAEGKESDLDAYKRYVEIASSTQNHTLDAIALAKAALTRWPDDPSALAIAAKAALAAGMKEDAKAYIDSALRIDPKNPDAQKVQSELSSQP